MSRKRAVQMKILTQAVIMIKMMATTITVKLSSKVQVKYNRPKIMMTQFAVMMIYLIALLSQIVKRFATQRTT